MRLRTGYSFRNAMGHLPEAMDRIDTDYAPITDRASTYGFNRWTKLCKERGKKPIYGVELAVSPDPTAKRVTRTGFTFIARDELLPLHQIFRKASAQFRYEPILHYHNLAELPQGLIIILGTNAIPEHIPLEAMLQTGNEVYYPAHPSTPKTLIDWCDENGIKGIACQDNYYSSPDDREAYEVLCGRGARTQTYPLHIMSRAELIHHCGIEAVELADEVASRCKAQQRTATLLEPDRPASLRVMCEQGAEKLGCDLSDPVYSERLTKELDLIHDKEFEDYFYIIADLIAFSKQKMFVGPARGSSCGSLVCYLLGITTIDPIPYDLIFERFIDVNRNDLPDIDIDFSDTGRQQAFDYLEEKYGSDRVARLGVVSLYKPKSAINETAAALGIPKWKVQKFTTSIVDRSGGDSRALQAIEDTFNDTDVGKELLADHPEMLISQRMEGHPRHHSQHAAGVVVTQEPVENFVAIDARANATQCDKKDAEDLNLLKIDALGLTQLSVFEDCLKAIGKPHDWLVNYPTDDPAAFAILNDARWSGIFQWNGNALQSLTQQFHVEEFEDMVSITALARPGPLNSGGATQWIDRKNGKEKVEYLHEEFKKHLHTSLGIVIYQEQVMSIGRDIGGLSWEDVSSLRKAMSKSMGIEFFDKYGNEFKKGAKRLGLSDEVLNKLWDDLCAYGAWSFNRSHSVAYGYISYWCCVLKAHYPLEFAAATLTHEKDPDRQLKLLREMVAEGYEYVPVDAEHSTDRWQVADGKLIGPLTNVKGLGPKVLSQIMEARRSGQPLPKRAQTLLKRPETPIDELYPVRKRLEDCFPEGLHEAGITSEPAPLIDVQCGQRKRKVVVVAKMQEINPRDGNELANVQKRGYRLKGNALFLNMVLEDDTDRLLARVNRFNYFDTGKNIVERGGAGDLIYVLSGTIDTDFRILNVERCKPIASMKGRDF